MSVSNSALPRTAQIAARYKKAVPAISAESATEEKPRPKPDLLTELTANRWVVVTALIVLLLLPALMAMARARQEAEGLGWLLTHAPLTGAVGDLATILAPLVAVSVAIERLLETFFDWIEQSSRAVAKVLATPREALDWIGQEYKDAYEAAEQIAGTLGVDAQPAELDLLKKAEERLSKAEARLKSWTSSSEYVAIKRAVAIYFGLFAGLVVSTVGDLGMLHLINLPAPRILDMIVTGIVIGAGPGPMHSLIGILQGGKDALENLSELAKGKALREQAEAILKATNASNS